MFGLWKRKPRQSCEATPPKPRSTAKFGGMQERVLQARIELLVDAVMTRHRSVIEPARALTAFSLVEQERFLASVDRISLHDPEFAFRFCHQAIPALAEMDDADWEPWVDELLETFSSKGLDASIANIETFRNYREERTPASSGVSFTEIARVLDTFIRALNGRTMKLATSDQSYTDTETLFLPEHINHFRTRDENFRLYKALLAHQWAQTWFGTWRVDLAAALKGFPDADHALNLFHWLETRRLDACLKRTLPGMARDMTALRPETGELSPVLHEAETALQKPGADVHTSLACLSELYPFHHEPAPALYQGQLRIEQTADVVAERGQRERSALQKELADMRNAIATQTMDSGGQVIAGQPRFNMAQPGENETTEYPQSLLEYDGAAVDATPELQTLLDSIYQDLGEIPEHYLNAPEDGELSSEQSTGEAIPQTNYRDANDFSYDEWDHSRKRYRKNWCLLHEQSVKPAAGLFVMETLNKHRALVKQLRRTFEAMRQEHRQMKREPFGDDIDIDASVEAWLDIHNGLEASERLFIRTRRDERHVAVMFMIDMSASTAGWVNRVERESLVLLCEALELLGDRYAIYGFSGRGNRHCRSFHIKGFDESYNDEVRSRIQNIQPHDYTRLGAAIRHLGVKLSQVEARTRLLITLSDGRPDDVDGYRGPYGIEDTRKALMEVRHLGIHPYCITIDTDAREYLPHMFGKNGFTIIDQVDKLPQRMADIYRRLTT